MSEDTDIVMHEPITDLSALAEQEIEFVPDQAIEQVKGVVSSTSFLPRLQVNGSSTELVKKGLMPVGTFGLVWTKEKYLDLGKEVVFMCLSLRSKALFIDPTGKSNPVSYYDTSSEDFARVMAKADMGGMNGNMYGPEFLVWLPNQGEFATFYYSSKTSRNVGPATIQLMRKDKNNPKSGLTAAAIRAKMKFIEGKDFTWWGHEVYPETSALPQPPPDFMDRMMKELKRFNNPPKVEVEMAPDQPATSRAR